MKDTEFAECIGLLNASIGKPMPVEMVKAWYLILGDLTFEQMKRGVVVTLKTHQFQGFPAVGLIRKNALSGNQPVNLEVTDRALLAWDCVLNAIRIVGGYRTVSWDDPVIPATIRAVATSWAGLCEIDSATLLTWTKKAFLESYRAIFAGGQVDAASASPLPGILAETASRTGYELPGAVAVETRLPGTNVKVLPGQTKTLRFDQAAEMVGKSLRLPPTPAGDDDDTKPIDGGEEKRAAAKARLMERFKNLVGPAK